MEVFRKRLNSVIETFRDYSVYGTSEREKIFDIKAEDNYCRDIIFAIRKLDQVTPATVEEKIDSIRRIGLVAWTGGKIALRRAGAQIPRLMQLFDTEPTEVRVEIAKSISQICLMNGTYQEAMRTNGYLKKFLDFLRLDAGEAILELQKWIVYCILCVLVGNAENQRFVIKIQHSENTFSRYQTEVWYKWNRNVALDLSSLLGFGYRQ